MDALVAAVREAQREVLRSPFWRGLLRCFATAEAELSTGKAATADGSTAAAGDSTAAADRATTSADGAMVAANGVSATVSEETAAAAGISRGRTRETAASSDSSPAAAAAAAAGSTATVAAAAPGARSAENAPASGPLSSTLNKFLGGDKADPAAEQTHRSTSLLPAPNGVLPTSATAEEGLEGGASQGASSREGRGSESDQEPGELVSITSTGLRHDLGQGLGHWGDVRQLLVFGLGSLESGA